MGEMPPSTFGAAGELPGPLAPPAAIEAAAVAPEARPVEGSEIIARVDGQIVLGSDLVWQAKQLLSMSTQPIPPDQRENVESMLTRRLLMGLIDTKLLYADFKRTVPAENLPKVEQSLAKPFEDVEVPRLLKMFKVNDRAALEDALKASGTSLKDVQRQFGEKTIAGEWLRNKMPKPKPITYEILLAYYQDNLKKYEFPAQVKWEEVMVRFDRCGGDRAKAWQQLCEMGNEIWQTAAAHPEIRGPVFGAVAKAKSHGATAKDGGLQDWKTQGALVCEDLNKALATLAVGQLSDGIEAAEGFYIVRVLERKDAGRIPFTEAQASIRKLLEDEQRTAMVEAELKKLRLNARVWTVYDGELAGPRLAEVLDEQQKRR